MFSVGEKSMVGTLDNEQHGGPNGFKTDGSVIEIILTQ